MYYFIISTTASISNPSFIKIENELLVRKVLKWAIILSKCYPGHYKIHPYQMKYIFPKPTDMTINNFITLSHPYFISLVVL